MLHVSYRYNPLSQARAVVNPPLTLRAFRNLDLERAKWRHLQLQSMDVRSSIGLPPQLQACQSGSQRSLSQIDRIRLSRCSSSPRIPAGRWTPAPVQLTPRADWPVPADRLVDRTAFRRARARTIGRRLSITWSGLCAGTQRTLVGLALAENHASLRGSLTPEDGRKIHSPAGKLGRCPDMRGKVPPKDSFLRTCTQPPQHAVHRAGAGDLHPHRLRHAAERFIDACGARNAAPADAPTGSELSSLRSPTSGAERQRGQGAEGKANMARPFDPPPLCPLKHT